MEKKDTRQASALAIKNVGIIDQAYNLVTNEISDEVFSLFEKLFKQKTPDEWIKEFPNAKTGKFDANEDTHCAPINWKRNDEDWLAWFGFWYESKENKNCTMTMLLTQGEAELGISWRIELKSLLPTGNKKSWKNFASQQVAKHNRLVELGFRYDEVDGSWFLPISIDAITLADAYSEDTMEDALSPIVELCVKCLIDAVPDFDSIISEALKLESK